MIPADEEPGRGQPAGVAARPGGPADTVEHPAETAVGVWRRIETVLVVLVTLHTVAVGSMLLFATGWALRFGGWGEVSPHFFPQQGAAFHFVVAFGYLYEYFRHRGVALMIAAKSLALVFLLAEAVLDPIPWAVPVSGVLDGLMALVVLLVHRKAAWRRPPLAR